MEYFHREMRHRRLVLMDGDESPGGQWNYDADKRERFGAHGPGCMPPPAGMEVGALPQKVMAFVTLRYPNHPGELSAIGWPVTREQALWVLADFVAEKRAYFGRLARHPETDLAARLCTPHPAPDAHWLLRAAAGVDPKMVRGGYLSVDVDAVEWVELSNTRPLPSFPF